MADTPTRIRDLPIAVARNPTDVLEVSQADGVSRQMQVPMLVPAFPDLSVYAPKASPTFTGDPKAPTPGVGDNDFTIPTTAWVNAAIAAALPANQGGDFWARSSVGVASATAATVVNPNTVLTGNAGGWFNTANGRYTPAAGRYYIRCALFLPSSTTAVGMNVQLRKNGATILTAAGQVPGSAGWYGDPRCDALVDAGGADYYEMLAWCGAAQTVFYDFLAMPSRR
jgi:hypothetical protein